MNEPKQTITALELFDSSEVGINPKGYFDYSFTPEKLDMIRSYLAALYRMTDEADPHEALDDTGLDIVERLRGKVRVPITDGLGPVEEGGSADFFERTFPNSKLAKEAAAYIENIRDALTAQQPDVPRYDPRLGLIQKEPVNQELLEALKEAEAFIKKMSGGGETDFREKLNKAIARAEQKDGV